MVKYTIEKHIADIGSKQLTLTSWNGNPAKLDLRTWRTVDGEQQPGKGLTLTTTEAAALADALKEYLSNGE